MSYSNISACQCKVLLFPVPMKDIIPSSHRNSLSIYSTTLLNRSDADVCTCIACLHKHNESLFIEIPDADTR